MINTVFNENFFRGFIFGSVFRLLLLPDFVKEVFRGKKIQVNAMYSLYRIYERVIDPPETNLTPESNLWLGQRNRKRGFFKVSRYEMAHEEGK